jgi:putative flavoprotein involved in K+ transport
MSRLPGRRYDGPDPDGFATAPVVAGWLDDYAAGFAAPVRTGHEVRGLRRGATRFTVETQHELWQARHVVLATGAGNQPRVPDASRHLAPQIHQLTARDYRNPALVPAGNVLVVGASATGMALAKELRVSGRDVWLAAGRHNRVPRTLMGVDVFEWLARSGWLADTVDTVADPSDARSEPRLQLAPGRDDFDLGTLAATGVRVVGRVCGGSGHRVQVADDLAASMARAEESLRALITSIEQRTGVPIPRAAFPPAPRVRPAARRQLDLRRLGISTILWCTGYRPTYPFTDLALTGPGGAVVQSRGATKVPGLYVIGTRFQQRRDSSFLDGVRHDASDVVGHLKRALAHRLELAA